MTMEELVLDRLVSVLREREKELVGKVEILELSDGYLRQTTNQLRAAKEMASEPLRDLFEAAEFILKAATRAEKSRAISMLHHAIHCARPHIDLIPF